MKIQVEFLSIPRITRIVGSKSITFDLRGVSIGDLIEEISGKYGREISNFLLDESGNLDAVFKVQLNKSEWIPKNGLDKPLKNGDRVTFMMLLAGG